MIITCFGQSGHGSLLFKNTPGEKIHYIIDKFMNLRKIESAKLDSNPELTIGDVTTVNLTMLSGGSLGLIFECTSKYFPFISTCK